MHALAGGLVAERASGLKQQVAQKVLFEVAVEVEETYCEQKMEHQYTMWDPQVEKEEQIWHLSTTFLV